MVYLFTFIEGIASFVSPCLLPMIPIYISYFMGSEENKKSKTIINSIGFVMGFTIIFVILAILSSAFGIAISSKIKYIKIIFGVMIIILGLNYLDIIKINILNKTLGLNKKLKNINFFKALIFGMLFSISWTPCVGTFLSSALLLIANEQNILKGIILILLYSLGLGVPFIISAIFIEKLKEAFNFIKQHYIIIEKILILMGLYIIIF